MGLSSDSSHTAVIVGAVIVAVVGLSVWCGYALWGQFTESKAEGVMRNLQLAVYQYAIDNGRFCPEDLGALMDGKYCVDARMYRLDPARPLPKSGADVRAGVCDFGYLAKGMRMSEEQMKSSFDLDAHSFPLLYLKEALNGRWQVVYSDGHLESYEDKPGFLKQAK